MVGRLNGWILDAGGGVVRRPSCSLDLDTGGKAILLIALHVEMVGGLLTVDR